MVSSQILPSMKDSKRKPIQQPILVPMSPPDVASSEQLELDFSDVFGPLPIHASNEVSTRNSGEVNETVYDDPEGIYNRSHSLVGTSACVSQSLKLSGLTIHETEEQIEFLDSVIDVTCKNGQETFTDDSIAEVRDNMMKTHTICVEDFQVLKVVGQAAFAKVYQLYNQGLFRENLARIYKAEIVSAVSHLHANGIMHRDLKPENILLDVDGHVYLCGCYIFFCNMSRKRVEENTRANSLRGTVEYMSPEIILGKGHDKAADWWSVGILLFEMLTGKPPFIGGNREKIQQKIIKDKLMLPGFLSTEAHSLLKGLLQKDPSKRLGSGLKGSDEIKSHKLSQSTGRNWRHRR